jgi:hypothetical protein
MATRAWLTDLFIEVIVKERCQDHGKVRCKLLQKFCVLEKGSVSTVFQS